MQPVEIINFKANLQNVWIDFLALETFLSGMTDLTQGIFILETSSAQHCALRQFLEFTVLYLKKFKIEIFKKF